MPPTCLTLVPHTHWDREWYQPFEVFRAELVEMLDEALRVLELEPRLHFTLDGHVALVDDYLELRPEAEARIRALVTSGRLHIGPFYTQADTLLVDGESLIRNLALGLERAAALGGAMRVGYMADQFGHAAQLPQLLRLFGIDGAVLWRGVGPERPPHAFTWIAPDGSRVTTLWLQDGYGSGRRLPSDPAGFVAAVERSLERLGPWLGELPMLVPVGDDHTRLPGWLPAAAEALQTHRPDLRVAVGGYADHLPRLPGPLAEVRGELRSPAFAPVLAGVASARMPEKQAAARAARLLLRYAEPLAALASVAGAPVPRALLARAWRQLILNHAHDSAAGCGVDATHADVQGRQRWAEQLGAMAIRQVTQALAAPPLDEGALAQVVVFHPGPHTAELLVEAELARGLEGALSAVGPDGIARPIQALEAVEAAPLFEGEFSGAELGQYLGGLDPATPLFGKYLSGIVAGPDGLGRVRLDVGLAETPAPGERLAEDQARVRTLLGQAERFRVVLHGSGVTRRVLLAGGAAAEAALVPITIRRGEPAVLASQVAPLSDGRVGLQAGPLRVFLDDEGALLMSDERAELPPVRIAELVDQGDRGDLYHFEGVGAPIRARTLSARLSETGPLRGRLLLEQELSLPISLGADRSRRSEELRSARVLTEVTVVAGQRRVEVVTTLDNLWRDHRLRAEVLIPAALERIDAHHGLAVSPRPLDPASLGTGTERPAATGQHELFVAVGDGRRGVAVLAPGLPEHEVFRGGDGTGIALTLLRAVGWLARGDLACMDHAAGPIVPTPAAQELGSHRFEYAILPYRGDWSEGEVLPEARRFAAPPMVVQLNGTRRAPFSRALVELSPGPVCLTAMHPSRRDGAVVVRLLNASPRPALATLRPARACEEVLEVDPLEQPIDQGSGQGQASAQGRAVLGADGQVRVALGAWQLATILIR